MRSINIVYGGGSVAPVFIPAKVPFERRGAHVGIVGHADLTASLSGHLYGLFHHLRPEESAGIVTLYAEDLALFDTLYEARDGVVGLRADVARIHFGDERFALPFGHVQLGAFVKDSGLDAGRSFATLVRNALYDDALMVVDLEKIAAGEAIGREAAARVLARNGFLQRGPLWIAARRGRPLDW